MIDMNHFTPLASLTGGLLVGLAAALFLLVNGRIAGISGILGGIVAGLLRAATEGLSWRLAFVVGLLMAPWLYRLLSPLPPIQIDAGFPLLIIAGVLVGVGTRYGGGCTSGHGICGLSRLSTRSAMATLCFMLCGVATVFVVRHLLGGN